ncbi:MAG: hypothetical protein OEV94_06310 [Deltaproteobacteria bacterium]|nr:hypothetical protein [Deltaproteobacteria bacterium]
MNQTYIDTMRSAKTLLRNLERLEDEITPGQREELNRLLRKLSVRVTGFLEGERSHEGIWIGEE